MSPPLHISRRLMVTGAPDHFDLAVSYGATGYWPLNDSISTTAGTAYEHLGGTDNLQDNIRSGSYNERVTAIAKTSPAMVTATGYSAAAVRLNGQTSGGQGILDLGNYADYSLGSASFEIWASYSAEPNRGGMNTLVCGGATMRTEGTPSTATGFYYKVDADNGTLDAFPLSFLNDPFHFCLTQSYSGGNYHIRFYVNGALKRYYASPTGRAFSTGTSYQYFSSNATGDNSNISLQNAAFYGGVELNSTQINALMAAGSL